MLGDVLASLSGTCALGVAFQSKGLSAGPWGGGKWAFPEVICKRSISIQSSLPGSLSLFLISPAHFTGADSPQRVVYLEHLAKKIPIS